MKIFVVENNFKDSKTIDQPVFSLRPETSLLRNNQSFFFPDFTKEIICSVSVVVRISRIGRSIYEKFANRYYNQIGVGVCFTAVDILQNLQKQDLPSDIARCFDFSAPVSPDFVDVADISDLNIVSKLEINGNEIQICNAHEMPFSIEKIISHISQFVSFKIGDLIFINPPKSNVQIKIGDNLKASINNKVLLDFKVE